MVRGACPTHWRAGHNCTRRDCGSSTEPPSGCRNSKPRSPPPDSALSIHCPRAEQRGNLFSVRSGCKKSETDRDRRHPGAHRSAAAAAAGRASLAGVHPHRPRSDRGGAQARAAASSPRESKHGAAECEFNLSTGLRPTSFKVTAQTSKPDMSQLVLDTKGSVGLPCEAVRRLSAGCAWRWWHSRDRFRPAT